MFFFLGGSVKLLDSQLLSLSLSLSLSLDNEDEDEISNFCIFFFENEKRSILKRTSRFLFGSIICVVVESGKAQGHSYSY